MKFKETMIALTLASSFSATVIQALEVVNKPRGFDVIVSPADGGSNWNGFLPSGNWSGLPQPGCMIFGPYYSNTTAGTYLPSLSFKEFNIGSRPQNKCTKRDVFKSCVERDRRDVQGSLTIDLVAHVGGEAGSRVVWSRGFNNQMLKNEFGFEPKGTEQRLFLPAQSWPKGASSIEMRVCNIVGVERANTRIQYTGSKIEVSRSPKLVKPLPGFTLPSKIDIGPIKIPGFFVR